ncbi:hypothetical protein N7462_001380 [Penicillium macrosclerotiorum]|uniref:uncharacterized protein n=1 Tax=Penicillium macrosclerotiorum TaxID=303699 RepID=UPI002547FBA0|nr:uncharacterized protein N7462_001380 [Penicillium macrosclerotiorum]KAJ5691957.1 hypothetical protein N7462_001380 [Penicillium macrosclerotiorum]
MTRCGVGCTDENADCNACYIWFNGLCNCLKRLTGQLKTGCEVYPKSTLTIGQRTPPAWILNNQHDIITTTYKIPGILELHDVPDYNGGFDFGQNKLQGDKHGALALNPAASRSEEQLHIHLCTNDNDPIRDALTGLTRSGFTSLAPVDITSVKSSYGTMWCRVAPNKGDININQGQDILDYLQKIDTLYGPSNCERYHVGAGYMKDKNDYAWSCVTTASSAEGIFCHS